MRYPVLLAVLAGTLYAAPAQAQNAAWAADVIKSTTEAEEKFVGLANALSDKYSWRPGEGVRSVQEVLLHVAADNYFIPAAMGVPAPAVTRITSTDFAAMQAFEKQALTKDATIAAVKTSFEHLRKALAGIPEARMNESIKVFGMDFTVRQFMLLTTTHMHEHLGQMIAYARTNNIKPPWSR
jgi:uncharacterized damage-inducible protein DinB